ncbi:DegT/DnrJ/EryC1/StrS family aminotransferase [Sphingomonas baiyangensis]|uniref:DegT/DnrJ/EryC1/StrS aminotransferase family protein n=1 Tax=Sphingomonas baiyangensis TaxID=2572576 RepID=A0A4U1L702_9SPHN|nr:DegT/DnrJ/EryC1/StrS aminotransferase family protein [Sphingomonas baiyangensis]TKD52016.1 DegT/DnrJ/EryC1/StrS aminotransferase family protein [Sphingomonas baiyangensis]
MSHATLAIDGGTPLRERPFAPWPHFADDEVEAAAQTLRTGRVNQWTGSEVRDFEADYAAALGARHAIALANGTLALELALMAYGIGPGDEVVTTPRTFIASASAVVMRGATPVLADVDPVTQNITPETIAAVLTPATRAIIAVHLAGWPCDMRGIMALARERGLVVIEDCAQAHGAEIDGEPVGSFGDAAAFSFCQDKIITTGGEGGLLVLDDEERYRTAWAYKDHGKSYAAVFEREHAPGFRWLHESFGTNWRLTEFQAAIGRLQLAKLPGWTARRIANAEALDEGLGGVAGLHVATLPAGVRHARYKYYVQVDADALADGWDNQRIAAAVTAEGVPCFTGSCSEIYLEKAFVEAKLGPAQRLPNAVRLGRESLMLLVHPTLGEADMHEAAAALAKVMNVARR